MAKYKAKDVEGKASVGRKWKQIEEQLFCPELNILPPKGKKIKDLSQEEINFLWGQNPSWGAKYFDVVEGEAPKAAVPNPTKEAKTIPIVPTA